MSREDRIRDELARLRAQMDQQAEKAAEVAPLIRRFNRALVEAGFREDQAFELTRVYLEGILRK